MNITLVYLTFTKLGQSIIHNSINLVLRYNSKYGLNGLFFSPKNIYVLAHLELRWSIQYSKQKWVKYDIIKFQCLSLNMSFNLIFRKKYFYLKSIHLNQQRHMWGQFSESQRSKENYWRSSKNKYTKIGSTNFFHKESNNKYFSCNRPYVSMVTIQFCLCNRTAVTNNR